MSDRSNNAIGNEDDERPACPYCDATENCVHLLVQFDRHTPELYGPTFERIVGLDELSHAVEDLAVACQGMTLQQVAKLVEAKLEYPLSSLVCEAVADEGSIYVQRSFLAYLEDLLPGPGVAGPLIWEFEGGPGQSVTYDCYYAEDPKAACEAIAPRVAEQVSGLNELVAAAGNVASSEAQDSVGAVFFNVRC